MAGVIEDPSFDRFARPQGDRDLASPAARTGASAGPVPVPPGGITARNPSASGMPARRKCPSPSVCVSRLSESFVQTHRTMAFAAARPPGKVTFPVTSRPGSAFADGPPARCAERSGSR